MTEPQPKSRYYPSEFADKTPCQSVLAPCDFSRKTRKPCSTCVQAALNYYDSALEKDVRETISGLLRMKRAVLNESMDRTDGKTPIRDLIEENMRAAAVGDIKLPWQKK